MTYEMITIMDPKLSTLEELIYEVDFYKVMSRRQFKLFLTKFSTVRELKIKEDEDLAMTGRPAENLTYIAYLSEEYIISHSKEGKEYKYSQNFEWIGIIEFLQYLKHRQKTKEKIEIDWESYIKVGYAKQNEEHQEKEINLNEYQNKLLEEVKKKYQNTSCIVYEFKSEETIEKFLVNDDNLDYKNCLMSLFLNQSSQDIMDYNFRKCNYTVEKEGKHRYSLYKPKGTNIATDSIVVKQKVKDKRFTKDLPKFYSRLDSFKVKDKLESFKQHTEDISKKNIEMNNINEREEQDDKRQEYFKEEDSDSENDSNSNSDRSDGMGLLKDIVAETSMNNSDRDTTNKNKNENEMNGINDSHLEVQNINFKIEQGIVLDCTKSEDNNKSFLNDI